MKEFKGTEGRWVVKPGSVSGFVVQSESAPKLRKNIASCGGQRREENAKLIAAAPELLEALQEVLYELSVKKEVHEGTINQAELSIAKALGESK